MRKLTQSTASVAVLALLWSSVACQTGPPVPRVQQSTGPQPSLWSRATIVAVGTVDSPHRVGVPQLWTWGNTSGPAFPCQAQFHATALLKSEAGIDNRKVLWFSLFPTCGFGLKPGWAIRSVEQVWFLRSEGTWLRPVTDPGGTFVDLFQHFEAASNDSETVRQTLSRYLLNPAASAETEERFIQRFNELFRLSCEIAGEQWSLQVLGDLQRRASPKIRGETCRLLAGDYDQCRFSDCPPGSFYPGTDGARGDQNQAAHKSNDLLESSEEHVKGRLKSGQPREWEQRQLEVLSCNFDPVIRQRAGKLLRKYFPESRPAPCISCR